MGCGLDHLGQQIVEMLRGGVRVRSTSKYDRERIENEGHQTNIYMLVQRRFEGILEMRIHCKDLPLRGHFLWTTIIH